MSIKHDSLKIAARIAKKILTLLLESVTLQSVTPINTLTHMRSKCLPAAACHLLLQNQITGPSHAVCRRCGPLLLSQTCTHTSWAPPTSTPPPYWDPGHHKIIRCIRLKGGLKCSCQRCVCVFMEVHVWVSMFTQYTSVHSLSSTHQTEC